MVAFNEETDVATTNNTIITIPEYATGVIEGGLLELNFLNSVFDAEGDTLRWTLTGVIATDPMTGAVLGNSSLNNVSISATGSFTYDATLDLPAGQSRIETFNFMVYDGMAYSNTSIQIFYTGAGTALPAPDDYGATASGQPIFLNVLANDGGVFPDGTRTPTTVTSINGQPLSTDTPVTIYHPSTGNAIGTVAKSTNEALLFTPLNGYTGAVSFSYGGIYELSTGGDLGGIPYSQQVFINVIPAPVPDPVPVGVADVYALPLLPIFAVGQMQGVLVNDFAASGAGIGAQLVRGPSQGVLDFNSDGSFTYQATPEMLASAPGTVQQVTFSYRVLTGVAQAENETLVTLQLRNPTTTPVAFNDELSGIEDQRLVITVESLFGSDGAGPQNDTQSEGEAFTEIRILRLPDNGSLTLDGVAIGLNEVVSVVQLAAGKLVFTPAQDFFGTTSFEYAVRSIDEYSLPATVTLNIASVPDRPLLQSDPPEELLFTEAVDAAAQSLTVPLLPLQFIDRDSASLSVETSFELTLVNSVSPIPTAVTQALENALSITTSSTPLGSGTMLTISPTLSSAPMNLDFLQAGESIRFRYKLIVSDGDGLRSGAIIPLELTGSNDAPIASDFETSIRVGDVSTADANLLIHVTDPDAGDQPRLISVNDTVFGDRFSIFLPTAAGVLQINSDGSYSFLRTPENESMASSESIPVNLQFQVADSMGSLSTANASLNVSGVNDAPRANADNFAPVLAGSTIQFATSALLANDSDSDNHETALLRVATFGFMGTVVDVPLSGTTTLNGTYGVLTIDANGQLSYAATTTASSTLIKGVQATDIFS